MANRSTMASLLKLQIILSPKLLRLLYQAGQIHPTHHGTHVDISWWFVQKNPIPQESTVDGAFLREKEAGYFKQSRIAVSNLNRSVVEQHGQSSWCARL